MAIKKGKTMSEKQSEIIGETQVPDSDVSIENAKEATSPNVIWRGETDPPAVVLVGMTRIELPDAAAQRKGFFSTDAALLIRSVAGFKALVPKG